MPTSGNKVLARMLDRLLAGLMSGPNMNCRPHNSRPRVDLTQLTRLADIKPEQVLIDLLNADKCTKVTARVKMPRKSAGEESEKSAAEKAWLDQSNLLNKLRVIADDARTYENDTGVHALSIGFPILSLPPGSFGGGSNARSSKRILAPIAFIPVTLSLKRGATPVVEIACRGEGADRVSANTALLSWIEQQTGKPQPPDAFEDEEGKDPWREINELVKHVADAMHLKAPEELSSFGGRSEGAPSPSPGIPGEGRGEGSFEKHAALEEPGDPHPDPLPEYREREQPAAEPLGSLSLVLTPAPRGDDDAAQSAILLSAVLGLFPTSHQGLLRDTRAMLVDETCPVGPIRNFLTSNIDFDAPAVAPSQTQSPETKRTIANERLATNADPCQAKAVSLARESTGLVIHGPPGTGKSQTITNIVADHLARGQRVLLVCDKRTALDVVADRLEHMGLRSLCGIVHDPQRDQRDLYRSIHQQLDELPEAKVYPRAEAALEKADIDLQHLHDELTGFHDALMKSSEDGGLSFHELMGRWMAIHDAGDVRLEGRAIAGISIESLESYQPAMLELFQRATAANYSTNLWTKAAGVSMADYLSRPMAHSRTALDRISTAAAAADGTADARIIPFTDHATLAQQAAARANIADELQTLIPKIVAAKLTKLASMDLTAIRQTKARIDSLASQIKLFREGPIDAQLLAFAQPAPASTQIQRDLLTLKQYIDIADSWLGLFAFSAKREAAGLLKRYALPRTKTDALRVQTFLAELQARLALLPLLGEASLPSDEFIERFLQTAHDWLPLLDRLATNPALEGIGPALNKTLAACGLAEQPAEDAKDPAKDFIEGLKLSTPRADALIKLEEAISASNLFDANWLAEFNHSIRIGKPAADAATRLNQSLDHLEGVLRVREGRTKLPAEFTPAVDQMLAQVIAPDQAISALQQSVLTAAITRRLRDNPTLQGIDTHRVESNFDRYRELDDKKKKLVRDVILNRWISKQKDRLLNSTGGRLNGAGADLRRRFVSRGQNARRLRQVISIGESVEGDDPLFDLCPVWMASPETVAQIFPRKAMFDVIIFDEASQCRLEEALPVLTRGQRVVIAGDQNQLPPTRFFESGMVQSQQDDPETDQELFETQQGEVEDLLSAALNLAIQQCYLDVHYRSRNADLIEFSNQNFYASRLQAIPAHPSNRSRFSPLTLYRVDGTYNKRQNEAEADRVAQIVHDLLKRAEPPSIGIACLNLPQRDLIVEKLEDLAGEDADFARRLAAARTRKGQGSFEGLFVKNLENVQGDERDHIIISTTYGPDGDGKFHRRFGPLGMAGGGRRLNVLVTRARCEVHLVTSIPVEAYRNLPAIPEGQSATGAWLLFAYLKYAESLADLYGANVQRPTSNAQLSNDQSAVNVLPSKSPSAFAVKLAESLSTGAKIGSDVHWGNEGFNVDLALHHPARPGDVTIGVMCDGCRYTGADDAVEWDIFRTGILESQGWQLHRIWTPHYFRDPAGNQNSISKSAGEFVANEKPIVAIATT